MRRHTATQKGELQLQPANREAGFKSKIEIKKSEDQRTIKINGIPEHQIGKFPNSGNPNRVAEQSVTLTIPTTPKAREKFTDGRPYDFGVAINGVLFDPGAGEFWQGNPRYGWQYEALSGAVPLGLDENFAHVQPGGKYHYHGLPSGLLKKLNVNDKQHSPLIGWAADGFPVYALYGFKETKVAADQFNSADVVELKPSYRLKSGDRPKDRNNPGGKYDGTFTADYEYVEGLGDLDEANGRFCVTPDFPEGTYAYFLTRDWPVVPRSFRGFPDRSFAKQPPGGPGGFQRQGPGGRRPPPRGFGGRGDED